MIKKSRKMMTKEKKTRTRRSLTVAVVVGSMLSLSLLTACGQKKDITVEDEVAQALLEENNIAGTVMEEEGDSTSSTTTGEEIDSVTSSDDELSQIASDDKENQNTETKKETVAESSPSNVEKYDDTPITDKTFVKNPYVGYNSKSTDYDIKFTLDTDSGLVCFVWGYKDGADKADKTDMTPSGNHITGKKIANPGSDYYMVGIDMTYDFPRLYVARRGIDAKTGLENVYEESYTNLDMMYPEMDMYRGTEHYLEIQVSGMHMEVKLDSYPVYDGSLADARPIGQIGTWVQKGNYHATFDDLFAQEGFQGGGDWLYYDEFEDKASVFSPYLSTSKGKLYAKSGLYFVPRVDN